jgi:histidyl-tRNA synthetase
MTMSIQKPKGTQDMIPGEVEKWQWMEEKARDLCRRYHIKEIRTPIFESTELFLRGVGETTDIVEKEMYSFKDKGDRSITLRPEGTAPAVRAYVESKLFADPDPVKLYYMGPMFRYERPQSGRFRQFHQFGVEVLGSKDAAVDAEVISIALQYYKEIGLTNLYAEINSVGCKTCRPIHKEKLTEHLHGVKDQLCKDCQSRLERNPLRILDCKNETCQSLTKEAPTVLQHLCGDCEPHFALLQKHLDEMGIPYKVNDRIVRGLDYYTQTAFEIIEKKIGAVSTLCGGGRYNGLVADIGGNDMPGIGFAMGMERTLIALREQGVDVSFEDQMDVYFIALGDDAHLKASGLLYQARQEGLVAETDYLDRKMKAQMKSADRNKARFVVMIGEDELAKGIGVVKNMATGEQSEIELDRLVPYLKG